MYAGYILIDLYNYSAMALNHYVRTLFSQKYSLQNMKSREFQTSRFQTTESLCSDTFQPKIFASKTSESYGME
jgi:hypothetical protein